MSIKTKLLNRLFMVLACLPMANVCADTYEPIQALQIGRLIAGLLFIVSIIFVLAWLYRRFIYAGVNNNHAICLESMLSVGNKERLAIIQVDKRRLLVGITPESIQNLMELDQIADPDLDSFAKTKNGEKNGFSALLEKIQLRTINSEKS